MFPCGAAAILPGLLDRGAVPKTGRSEIAIHLETFSSIFGGPSGRETPLRMTETFGEELDALNRLPANIGNLPQIPQISADGREEKITQAVPRLVIGENRRNRRTFAGGPMAIFLE